VLVAVGCPSHLDARAVDRPLPQRRLAHGPRAEGPQPPDEDPAHALVAPRSVRGRGQVPPAAQERRPARAHEVALCALGVVPRHAPPLVVVELRLLVVVDPPPRPSSAKDESASPRAKVEHEAPSSFYKVGALARRTSSPALFLVLCAITVIASAFVALVWTKVEPLTRTGARPGLVEVALAMVPRACTPAGLLVGAPSSPQHDAPSLLTGHGGATVPAAALEPATLEASVFKVEFTNSALLITVAIASLALWRAPRLPVVRRAEREAEKVSITVTSASAPQTSSSRCPSH